MNFPLRIGEGLTGLAVKERKLFVSDDTHNDPRAGTLPGYKATELVRLMASPLIVKGQVVGAILINSTIMTPFTANEKKIFTSITKQIAIALNNDLQKKQLEIFEKDLNQAIYERTEEMESLIYSISHQFKAPLRRIEGFSQALLEDYEDILDETGKSFLHRIIVASSELDLLVNEFLNVSKTINIDLNISRISLSDLVRKILTGLQKNELNRKFKNKIQENVICKADLRLVTLIIKNLTRNALKFTKNKDLTEIEFGMILKDDQPTYFIKDNGVGFDEKYEDNLFLAFGRLHKKSEFMGSGIGLYIVKRIIQKHGGKIWGESQVNQGATFYFTLGWRDHDEQPIM